MWNKKIQKGFIKRIFSAALFLSFIATSVAFSQSNEWKAPKEAENIKNPLQGNQNSSLEGKKLFNKMCVVCHGAKGKGDGIAGMNLKPRPSNLSASKVQNQSDGAIYWKITKGRTPMATYEAVLSKEQRWHLVNYIRQLSK